MKLFHQGKKESHSKPKHQSPLKAQIGTIFLKFVPPCFQVDSACLCLTSLLASEVIPICKTYSRHRRKPPWSNGDHLTELKHKKEVYGKWKTGYSTKEGYRSITWACRDGIGKTKVWLVLKQIRHVKCNKKGFCRYVGSKRKTRENLDLMLNQAGVLPMNGTEEAEVLNALFISVFTSRISC